MTTTYRHFRIRYEPPPIPVRSNDWSWAHEGYDGPDDPRCGTSASLAAAQRAIDAWYDEEPEGFCTRCGGRHIWHARTEADHYVCGECRVGA